MKKLVIVAALVAVGLVGPAAAFEISSPAIGSDNTIPLKYTANSFGCSGGNVSLPLEWKDVPAGAKSLAITIFDPDAPTGSGFWHWLVVNLPPSTTSLARRCRRARQREAAGRARSKRAAMPASRATSGRARLQGDTPHHYVITIFAVKADKLDIDANTSGAVVGFNLHFNTIDKASVTYT